MSAATDPRNLPDELRLDSQNPWPGLTAFTEKQHDFFYGRSLESHDLFACVKRERLTVLFGKSGLGKTSLLQAGLFPQLREADYLPVYVRLSYEDSAAPFDTQLGMALGAAIESANFAEVALPQQGETVWEYLHRRGGNLINDAGNVVMPVLIFDQFEECFTLAARKDFSSRLANEFLPGLGDMIENRIPASLTKKLTEDRDLAKRYDLEAHGCRILITLREDYLANLEALRDSMPSLVYIDNRMRLTEMTGEQALSVVLDPSPNLVDPDVAESIVRFVAGAHTDSADGDIRTLDTLPLKTLEVAPAILSLFCSQLNEERLKTPGMSKITRALVLSQGVTIIEDFYKKCIAGMHPAVRRLIEDRLLTSAGYRDNIDLAEARSTLERAGARPSYIDDLVRLRLLQIEDHRGVPRLELTHDVLAEPVKHSRDDYKKEQQREAAQQQERDALLRAKEAQEEALKRTRSLQKLVAAAIAVCLVLAAAVVFAVIKSKAASANAASAQQAKAIVEQELQQIKLSEARNTELTVRAQQEAKEADSATRAAVASKNLALANRKAADAMAQRANISAKDALESKTKLSGMNSQILEYCVTLYSEFDNTARGEKDEADQETVRQLYEHTLMDPDQCLALAEKAHQMDPSNFDVTDSLTLMPVRAADSASKRTANSQASRDTVRQDFEIEKALPVFQSGDKDVISQLEKARAYLAFAFIFTSIQDELAQPTAQEALKILAAVRASSKTTTWGYNEWYLLGETDNWRGIYFLGIKQYPEGIAATADALHSAQKAYELAPPDKKDDSLSKYRDRAVTLGDYQKDFGKDSDNAAIQTYQLALTLATKENYQSKITEICTDLQTLLVKQKRYDDAIKILQPRIDELSAKPRSLQRNKYLAQAFRDAAQVEEAREKWPQAIADRKAVLKTVGEIQPDDYTDQPSDMVNAHSLLSWDEIFGGDTDSGIREAHKAITLSKMLEAHPNLNGSYSNVIRALISAKQYEAAQGFLDEFMKTLTKSPPTVDREREFATVADVFGVQITQARGLKQDEVKYRRDEVARLTKLDPDAYTDLKADLVSAYGSLSFEEELIGNFSAGLTAAQTALKLDPSQSWIEENEAHALLFTGHPHEAHALYSNLKNIQWDGAPLSKAISDDFLNFCQLGYTNPEMASIITDLKIDNPDLNTCLKSPPHPTPAK